ncbi:MAG TPA: acetyl-CoA carboxylase biotin carboxyl carrier protein [Tepidisphaeraceae bacterium]|nr:acetyl-CoA carboxylase biotin carboxyl carrier protein [Tepidisphaeraceae bacterium]
MNNKKTTKKKPSPRGASSRGENSAPASGSPLDVRVLEQIVKLMSANDLNTIEVRDGDRRVILKRGVDFVAPNASSGFYASPPIGAPPPGLATGAATGSSAPSTPAVSDEANYPTIKSPMVGTFYSAASPEAKPFVSVGMIVDEDTDVCVIEAMKVFNNIKAEMRGTIVKILVTNGQTVEFGQPLFVVKP